VQAGATGVQYVFDSWSDSGAASHSVSAPTTASTIAANYITQYYLTTSNSSGGSIAPASGWFNSGSTVTVSAAPNTGYQFTGFGGALTGRTTPQSVTMAAPLAVTAGFSVSGTVLTGLDSTASGNSYSSANGVSAIAGWIGGAGSFNGSNGYLDLGTSASLRPSSGMTVSAWVNASATQLTYPMIVSDGDSSGVTGYNLYLVNQMYPAFIVKEGSNGWGGCYTSGPTAMNDGAWHLVTGVYAGSSISIYVDGVLAASKTGCTSQAINYGTSPRGEVGWKFDGASNDALNGSIDEVRISNISRSSDWIATEFLNQKSPSTFSAATITQSQAAQQYYTITGQVTAAAISSQSTTQSAVGLTGVTLALSSGAATSSNAGAYGFAGLVPGTYTVSATLPGATLSASGNSTITISAAGGSAVLNFAATGTDRISGTITQGGTAMSGVTVTVVGGPSNGLTATAVTDANGAYTFTGLLRGGYTLAPSLSGYAFTGTTYVTSSANTTVNFAGAPATYVLSGLVTMSDGVTGYSNVFVNITGPQNLQPITNAFGNYSVALQTPGVYTVTPTFQGGGGAFSPSSTTVTVPSGAASSVNFSAVSTVLEIITTSPSGLPVTVDGTTYTSPRQFAWPANSTHTVSVAATELGATSDVRGLNPTWSDGGALTHTITAAQTVLTASFSGTQYLLTATAGVGGSVLPSAPTWYDSGTQVTVTATANTTPQPYVFSNFSGTISSTSNPLSVTMNRPISEAANFTLVPTVPVITGVSPVTGLVGSSVKILCANLGTGQPNSVTFSPQGGTAVLATITSWNAGVTPQELVVTVPSGLAEGTATITVTASGSSPSSTFGVVYPSIASLSPTSGPANSPVTIRGVNFIGTPTVTFTQNGTAVTAPVDNSSATTISVRVPSPSTGLQIGSATVTLSIGTAAAKNSMPFTVNTTQMYTISGKVTANGGCPISSGNVTLAGSSATIGADGSYSLSAPAGTSGSLAVANATLTFSSVPVSNLNANQQTNFAAVEMIPTREYIRTGGRLIAIANCGSQ
jgi:hypothetical protein